MEMFACLERIVTLVHLGNGKERDKRYSVLLGTEERGAMAEARR